MPKPLGEENKRCGEISEHKVLTGEPVNVPDSNCNEPR